MEGESTLLGPSWTQKMQSNMGGHPPGSGTRGVDSSPPTMLSADVQAAMAGLSGDGTPADPSSVLLLQQNIQRLYGTMGNGNSLSRSSLHSILEDSAGAASGDAGGAGGAFGTRPDLDASADDLFLMDSVAGGTSGASPNAVSPPSGVPPGPAPSESRTLFIRGIDPATPDDLLREYLECFGDIHSLYTASKHRGYVMVTYHDIRAARLAQNTVHGQNWRGNAVSCAFSAETSSGNGGVTAAILLVAHDDGGRALDDAFYALSAFGELKELRREPTRPNIALAEFYDARHAAAALEGLSNSDNGGKLTVVDAGPSLSNLPPAMADVAGAWDALLAGAGMHQPVGVHNLANVTRTMQTMSLGGGAQAGAPQGGMGGGMVGPATASVPPRPLSSHDIIGMGMAAQRGNQGVYPLRGIQSTGSLAMWQHQAAAAAAAAANAPQLGTSPLQGGWAGPTPGLHQDIMVAQQQAAALALLQQNAAQIQLQQHAAVQNAAVHAALQQAVLSQQVAAAAALGLQASRRNFSEPALGGRLARRPMDPQSEAERRAQQERLYGLDLQRIAAGDDKRTTLMVKNIPNKYTQKMLLALMEERFATTVPFPFDFFYLPIDFKNRCNVGYAFINMTSPAAIPALVREFHGRRWPKFNSEKICRIAYARIQGKNALVQHFQNSSLLHEDKRCRPVLFGPNGEVETFPIAGE